LPSSPLAQRQFGILDGAIFPYKVVARVLLTSVALAIVAGDSVRGFSERDSRGCNM
jgi:hypothetical protein